MRARLWFCVVVLIPLDLLANDLPPTAGGERFEKKIRPLLASRCWSCHGAEKSKGGLRLDSASAIAEGGDSGASVVPGKPDESLLIKAVRYHDDLKMPPKGKLGDAEVAELVEWVRLGAEWPGADPTRPGADPTRPAVGASNPKDDAFWAFQPRRDPVPPSVEAAGWPKSPIDRFILSAIERKGLSPAPEAEKRVLIRRASFDLTGLPPSPGEVEAFLEDRSPEAFAKVVDRLLASPRYGERWGRHWLDLARYADSNGMDENMAQAHAFRYRDYVIRAFNADKPYDQFLQEQIAGDRLPTSGDEAVDLDRLVATGFLVLGPKMLAEDDPVKMEMDIIDEQVDTVGRVFLGLTLGCARCHDHKFDPIPTVDYYGIAGIFKSTKSMQNHKVVAMWNERPLATKAEAAAIRAHQAELARRTSEIDSRFEAAKAAIGTELRSKVADYLEVASRWDRARQLRRSLPNSQAGDKPPENLLEEWCAAASLHPRLVERWGDFLAKDLERAGPGSIFREWHESLASVPPPADAARAELAGKYQKAFDSAAMAGPEALKVDSTLAAHRKVLDDAAGPFSIPEKPESLFPPPTVEELRLLREARAELEKKTPPTHEAMAVEDQASTNLRVHIRGNHLTLGEEVPRHFPKVLTEGRATPIESSDSGRLELANWLSRPDHPLTARVMVNRIWQGHFGEGILRTPDNFGHLGDRPDHPELLDWLASRFVESGWSVKAMHRLIMLSSTYRMSTQSDARASLVDPENRLFSHRNRRRLEAETVRDAILAVSGELDLAEGGSLLTTKNHAYISHSGGDAPKYDGNRRSVYLPVIRSGLYDVFQAFDFADPSASNGQRIPTTVAPQALFMMNDKLVLRGSEAMGRRLLGRVDLDDPGRIRLAYLTAYGRPASEKEVERAGAYLGRFRAELEAQAIPADARAGRAWQALCQAILGSSEFLYLD